MNIVVIIGTPTREYESAAGHTRFRVQVECNGAPEVTVNVQPPAECLDVFRDALIERLPLAIDGALAQIDDGHATVLVERAHIMRPMVEQAYQG